MNVQKLNETLRTSEMIKQGFSSNTKSKIISLFLFETGHKFERNGPKISFWRSDWIRKFLYELFFFANSIIFRLRAILHESAGSVKPITKKALGTVMLHRVSLVHAFLFR